SPPTTLTLSLHNNEVEKQVERLRRSRFYPDFQIETEANRLAQRLIDGDYSQASDSTRARAIAMCTRWQARSADAAYVEGLLTTATNLVQTEEAVIASAFVAARSGWRTGLEALAPPD